MSEAIELRKVRRVTKG